MKGRKWWTHESPRSGEANRPPLTGRGGEGAGSGATTGGGGWRRYAEHGVAPSWRINDICVRTGADAFRP